MRRLGGDARRRRRRGVRQGRAPARVCPTRAGRRSTGSPGTATPTPTASPSPACPGSTSPSRGSRRRCSTPCAGSPPTSSSAAAPISPRATSGRSCARSSSGSRRSARERLAIVGGVAANSALRAALPGAVAAPLALCTDNAAMIALGRPLRHGARAGASTLRWMRLRARPELRFAALLLIGVGMPAHPARGA